MPTLVLGTRLRNKPAPRSGGFTILEIAVVMLVLAILLGMASVNLMRDNTDVVRDEAQRLAQVLQHAQQQAILEGRPYYLSFTEQQYKLLSVDANGKAVPIADDTLKPRQLPKNMRLGLSDLPSTAANPRPLIPFEPTGEFNPFTLTFKIEQAVWYVHGNAEGQIQPSAKAAAP